MKIKNTILATLCIMGLGGALALTPILNNKQNNNEEIVIRQENKKFLEGDNDSEFYLTGNDLYYTYENFYNGYLDEFFEETTFGLNFNEFVPFTFIYDERDSEGYLQYDVRQTSVDIYTNHLYFITDSELYYSNNAVLLNQYTFYIEDLTTFEKVPISNTYTLTIQVADTDYSLVDGLLELDIQANNTSMGDSITGAITSGLGLVGSLATEFITGFSALLWNSTSNTLTSFGTFALVFLGIAITMAVIKLVLAILRGNTGA